MDYIIADRTVVPKEHFPFYSEQVVWLPDTYPPRIMGGFTSSHVYRRDFRGARGRKPFERAVGLPELVTMSLEDYEALALKLAHDLSFLQAIKAKLVHNRSIQ